MQAHLNEIENILEAIETHPEILKKIITLTPVQAENILIVDDNQAVSDEIKAMINRLGNIDVACNGQEAMNMI